MQFGRRYCFSSSNNGFWWHVASISIGVRAFPGSYIIWFPEEWFFYDWCIHGVWSSLCHLLLSFWTLLEKPIIASYYLIDCLGWTFHSFRFVILSKYFTLLRGQNRNRSINAWSSHGILVANRRKSMAKAEVGQSFWHNLQILLIVVLTLSTSPKHVLHSLMKSLEETSKLWLHSIKLHGKTNLGFFEDPFRYHSLLLYNTIPASNCCTRNVNSSHCCFSMVICCR